MGGSSGDETRPSPAGPYPSGSSSDGRRPFEKWKRREPTPGVFWLIGLPALALAGWVAGASFVDAIRSAALGTMFGILIGGAIGALTPIRLHGSPANPDFQPSNSTEHAWWRATGFVVVMVLMQLVFVADFEAPPTLVSTVFVMTYTNLSVVGLRLDRWQRSHHTGLLVANRGFFRGSRLHTTDPTLAGSYVPLWRPRVTRPRPS